MEAQQTPLTDHLRSVPKDHRTEWQNFVANEPFGHTLFPVGRFAHEAADRIEHLDQQLQQAEARVAELEKQAAVTDSLIDNRRSRRWHETHTKEGDEAWLLRKQAEALDDFLSWAIDYCSGWAQDDMGRTYWHDKQIEGFANNLRQQADEIEHAVATSE